MEISVLDGSFVLFLFRKDTKKGMDREKKQNGKSNSGILTVFLSRVCSAVREQAALGGSFQICKIRLY